jgi:tetratricopeptide (TPR) repeat protein
MKIRIINKSRLIVPEYTTKNLAGIDLRANIEYGLLRIARIQTYRKTLTMKRSWYISFILAAGIILASCNKNIIPGLKPGKAGNAYDSAAFNYIYVEGIRQKLLGNMGEALQYFEQCLLVNPESDATYYQLAQIVLAKGDLANGKKYIIKANEIEQNNLWYSMLLASIYHQEGKIDSAIVCYEKAVKAYPEKEELQVSLAKLYTQNKNYDKARNLLNKLDEKYGVNERTTLSLIENLMADGKRKEALVKVQQLLVQNPDDIVFNGYLAAIYRDQGDIQKAKDVYNQLIARNPDNPGIQLSLCEFLVSEKNFEELFELLNIVIVNPKISRDEKISLISDLMENDDIIKEQGNKMELAIRIMEANYIDDDIILLLRPEFLQNENKTDEAASRLEEIIKDNPDNYYAWEKLLLVYYNLKNFEKLQIRGMECATKYNRSIIAKMLYATAAMENEDFTIALEELRKADILAGENKELKLQVQTLKADTYYRMKNYTEAFKAFDEALKLDNSDLTVMNNYAYYLAEQDMNLKEAEKMAKDVIESEKENNTYLDTYAWVLYKRGKTREAAKIMEKIINSGQQADAEYFEHYGYILKKMKKCSDAIKSWETAMSIDKTKINLYKEIENCEK